MHDVTAKPVQKTAGGNALSPRYQTLQRRFPTVAHLRAHARRHVPHFAFEYLDGGAGQDGNIARNWSALDAVEMVPRYGVSATLPPVDTELFGRRYAAPFGIAPMGGPVDRLAGRRPAPGAGRAGRARALCAEHGRRHQHRARRRARARRVLVPALPLRARRSQGRLRPGAAGRCGRRPCARAHHGRAGAHHALARSGGRHRLSVPHHAQDGARRGDLAVLRAGAVAARHHAVRLPAVLCGRGCVGERDGEVHAGRAARRLHLGGGGALPRCLETAAGAQGHPASERRREGGRARRRRPHRFQPRRPPGRRPPRARSTRCRASSPRSASAQPC